MRLALPLLLTALALGLPLAAAKRPSAAQLETQVKRLTTERDDLKQRLAATEDIQQELSTARKARDLAKAEAEATRKESDQLRATLKENQGGGDAILKELQEAKEAAAAAKEEAARLSRQNEDLKLKVSATPTEGDLVILGVDLKPARAINLNRITPHIKGSGLFTGNPKGVVVVNVLISEKGDVLAARLLQSLPGDAPVSRQAEEACVEAAKHIVFDPATSADGKTKFKVWQGVGFYLD
jgi:hypothetical protein